MAGKKRVHFWDAVNGDWVKITLEKGQTLIHRKSGYTDEGWFSEETRWSFDEDGTGLSRRIETDGRDCDGRVSSYLQQWCPLCDIDRGLCFLKQAEDGENFYSDEFYRPIWQDQFMGQRDYSAEAMGY